MRRMRARRHRRQRTAGLDKHRNMKLSDLCMEAARARNAVINRREPARAYGETSIGRYLKHHEGNCQMLDWGARLESPVGPWIIDTAPQILQQMG